ncbi:MAG: tRNA (adenosine(37)-N6)-threonylcarbamoyltransferase complex transferase subunit TsaD [Planctomycetaceae bacterium]|nr:tRNA (adenosine(37)-N6)-threonylcarbamoyltransferase complex transferase subunit TsaD [Planctomycetaceae bacterium]
MIAGTDPLILGVESSCDETAAALVTSGRAVRANIIASQHDLHRKFGGIVPEIASRAHVESILPVMDQALEAAGASPDDIDAVAVGNRPGLIGSLLVGVSAAKALAWALDRPLIGVNHVQAHLYAAALDAEPIEYPALGLVVSGGHTNLYAIHSPLHMQRLGRTIDDAVGEAYDKVAAILHLGFPGGPVLDRLAQQGDAAAVRFPRTLLDATSLDFSYSGLKTAVLYHVRGKPQGRGSGATFPRDADALSDDQKAAVAAAFQAAAIDVLIAKLQRAMEGLSAQGDRPRSVVIGGGVSANSLLRQRVAEFGHTHQITVRIPDLAYCLDNAAMIAGLAHHRLADHRVDDLTLPAIATTES